MVCVVFDRGQGACMLVPYHRVSANLANQSSSFVGPLVGLIAETTGNIRYAFLFLVLVVWTVVPVLLAVDVEAGRADAQAYVAGKGRRG